MKGNPRQTVCAEASGLRMTTLLSVLEATSKNGEVTAAMLAESTGLSGATVSRALSFLKNQGLMVQTGKEHAEYGRRPELFCINARFGYFLYFHLDTFFLTGYLMDLRGQRKAAEKTAVSPYMKPAEFLTLLQRMKEQLLSGKTKAADRLLAAILAVPGISDDRGILSRIPDFTEFEQMPLEKMAETAIRVPCRVYNVSKLAAVGEYLISGADTRNAVYMDVTGDCGIGAGIILDGELYEGSGCQAGEIGDMIVDLSLADRTNIQELGALENQLGLEPVIRRVKGMLSSGRAPVLAELLAKKPGTEIDLKLMEKAASMMDLDMLETLNDTARGFAAAIVNIVTVIAPEVVIIGGAFTEENQLMARMVRRHLQTLYYRPVELRFAGKNSDAHVAGAVHQSEKVLFEAALCGLDEQKV